MFNNFLYYFGGSPCFVYCNMPPKVVLIIKAPILPKVGTLD